MKSLSAELIAILSVGVVMGGVVLTTTGRLGARLDGLDGRLRNIERNQAVLIERVVSLDNRMVALEDRMTVLEDRMIVLEDRMTAVENRVASLEERVASLEERMAAVENRLDVVERQLRSAFAVLHGARTRLRARQRAFGERIAQVNGLLDGLRATVDQHRRVVYG